ncbi:MAG: UDP-N-acetylmuramate--L-alanine ligase [Candidatus Tectomicrobia bacterium]|uniref:UDP-N-acetylmuramate--L-alanine ligase n=1 Tax=Tectimicrobiota bacterium TaxID=2528274 RepID=A0A932CQ30_UNCTE|nr:UDP-N-acetylmuramate--L-alanine ligase [Candidatus Tectomicrobia bacterium]
MLPQEHSHWGIENSHWGIKNIHFVGIGGIGMSGIAEILLNLGFKVSGSDLASSETTERLARLGADISLGHRPENIRRADVVVVSSAVRSDNVEVQAAREKAIPVIPRAEMLAELMRMKYGIAIAGAHGKTTTSSMIAAVLARGGLDPTAIIGGKVKSLGSNAHPGKGDFLVAEADESDRSFLRLSPTIAVVTTLDEEHLDHYRDLADIQEAFLQFINRVPFYGLAVLCSDEVHLQELLPQVEKRTLTYGLQPPAHYQGRELSFQQHTTTFTAYQGEEALGRIRLPVPGQHNIANALGAIAVGMELGIPFSIIREALESFTGIQRRFEVKGESPEILLVDDYGHHPTEIQATLRAAKAGWGERRLVVTFQPHRYTRTHTLFDKFISAFDEADLLILTRIYPAGELPIPGVDSRLLYEKIQERGHPPVLYFEEKEEIIGYLLEARQPGDLLLTLGAGDIWKVGEAFWERYQGLAS